MPRYIIVGLCLALILTGCAHREVPVVSKVYPSQEAKDLETERAMKQLREADVAIDYHGAGDHYVTAPPNFGYHVKVSLPELARAVSQATTNRQLAVVTMDSAMRLHAQTEFDARVDEVGKMLRGLGFQKVVFHLASATGRPIYRE